MDLHTFMATIKRFSTHPMMKLILLPFMLLLYGIVFGSRVGKINFFGNIVLLLFVLLIQFLEQYFYLQQTKKGTINWQNVYPIIGVISLLILLMLPLTNVVFAILALTYFASILLIYGFFKLRGSVYFIIIQVFLKGLVLTVLSAFMQINFISYKLLLATLPILSVLLFYYCELEKLEIRKYRTFNGNQNILKTLSLLGLVATLVTPFLFGSIALTSIIKVIVWVLVCALLAKVMLDNPKSDNISKTKNFMATVINIVLLVYCLV